jgi:glutamyl-Q tRNA(Asp) synthetase
MLSLSTTTPGSSYIGRFAPSPSGPLHFGSLLAALASFLDARANNGQWILRMEDLDPPREPEGAAEEILDQLLHLGLEWDGEVLYQSQRLPDYQLALQQLSNQGLCFACDCTRPQIRAMGSVYNGACRHRLTPPPGDHAIRLQVEAKTIAFEDLVQGHYQQQLEQEVGDFVIKRKDGLFAYQLAVVIDDALQQVSHVIRGYDLLDSTPRQVYLQQCLGLPTPVYGHIPVIVNQQGQKLSKQHFAKPIESAQDSKLIFRALQFLGQAPPQTLRGAASTTQLQWAIENWHIQAVPKLANIPDSSIE